MLAVLLFARMLRQALYESRTWVRVPPFGHVTRELPDICPMCGGIYMDCPCPTIGMYDPRFEYKTVHGEVFARRHTPDPE